MNNPKKIEICAEFITNSNNKTHLHLNKTNQSVNYYTTLVKCTCNNKNT